MREYIKFLVSMLKVGCLGFGGGNAMVPVIEKEVVEQQKLDTKDNYDKDVIVANITPGSLTVKLAAAVGRRGFGSKGMVGGAFMMALPGCLLALLLFMVMSLVQEKILGAIRVASIGASAFIIFLLIDYVVRMFDECKKESKARLYKACIVLVAVFVLVCEKNIYKIFDIDRTPVFGISAIHILMVAFFFVFYTADGYHKINIIVSVILGGIFLIGNGKSHLINNALLMDVIEILMLVLALWGAIKSIRREKDLRAIDKKEIGKDIIVWLVFMLIFTLPACMFGEQGLPFVGKGVISSLMSFGGGDAYLSIAEGMFVDTGMIAEDTYFGHVVSVVNVLPGSVLCKSLVGIGYYIGYEIHGSIWEGVLFGVAGFAASMAASCGIFSVIYHMYHRLSVLTTIQKITRWIRPMAAGLLVNVTLSLCCQGMNTALYLNVPVAQVVVVMFGLAIMNYFLSKRFHVKTGWLLLINLCVAAVLSYK